ncbi:MAG TPA: hypothetical protein VD908_19995 [Cytophagales bacterium]|nr:hypothetical protein [Cytophagales bacterium]
MMKIVFQKIINHLQYAIVLVLAVVIFCSCQKEEITFEGPYHVRFTDTLITVKESVTQPVKISIHNVGPILEEDILVKYSVAGSAREDVDYFISGNKGEVIIPAGESFGYIDLRLINNANNILESQELNFTLEEVTPSTLAIGRSTNGIIGKSFSLIIEDDCILSGTYKAYPHDSIAQDFPSINNITISSVDCIEYTLSNWDIYVTGFFPVDKNLIFIDNGDNSLTIPEQEEETFNEDFATMKGSGFIDPSTKRITLNIELVDIPEIPPFEITFYPQ